MYKKLKQALPIMQLQRIETSTGLGVPDIWYGYAYYHGWMELKELSEMPKREDTLVKIPWRPGQLSWFKEYKRKYRNKSPYILCLTIADDWYMFKDKEVKKEYTQEELKDYFICSTDNLYSEYSIDKIKNKMRTLRIGH